MINKHTLLYIYCFFLCVALTGCHKSSQPIDRSDIREWLSQDADSCLWYYTGHYTTLLKEKRYREMEQLYASVLRAMPEHPKGGKNMNYLMGWVLTYYYNALMYQDKADGSEFLTDSLLNSRHPYYTQVLRPELLAHSCKFYLAQNRMKQVDSIGHLFLSLPPTDDPRRDARTWHVMAYSLEFCSIDTKAPMQLMEHAVASCRKAEGKVGNEGEIYGYMGYLYWKNGEPEKAITAIQEAIDWYTARPGTPGDGLIECYNDLSQVYATLELFDKAIEANTLAVEASKKLDNWTLEEVYRLRAACFSNAGEKDSALFYIQEAIKATPKSAEKYFNLLLRINRLDYYYAAYPDSIAGQLDECCRLLKDTAHIDPFAQNYLYAYHGKALLRTPGHEKEGVEQLERSFRNFQTSHFPEGIISVGDELIRAYIRTGMPDRISSIYSLYTETSDSLRHRARANVAIGANVRYETGRKEQENLVLAAEVSLKQRTLIFTRLLVGLLFVILLVGGMYMRQRQRFLRQVSNARLSQISGLLQTQQELKEKNESLQGMQEELRQSNEALFEAKQELSRHNASLTQKKAVSNLRMKISTEIFNSDKEAEFRRSFTAFYPDYIPALHRLSPDITRTDELIAMLIILELSSDEIALTLGISKIGVNKARSRMRKRLGLAGDTKLEDFLKGIWD
ncbi:tetratricopeptide repeat protein [Bacteroides eggerthii]|uniref:tetratricopeptide repeat protein n=1 Tax=Bacteroides eggerthii TaxID=28111 RepID=UPI001C378EF0|nr:tetratricopeptide repeat protein [Bacteroides eggerthii]MBV3844390.1 tetratricopeptide repeat protein [Bacteroides eggerthii]MBV3847459.1 tetratricopeptide repeat protein [Bacteroides eggerthii]MBV3921243.1 tetratricopeptide repeat protein [Bacteroides eggerthii]MBV3968890.1 tetratricopeptide repeat protein [Bacteroides eggerthii]MBV3971809.1 tetratricopeptide repeat protein [Bacteroides eggerthii]